MGHQIWLGALVVLGSSLFNGSFLLPMKWVRAWRWENTWLLFCLLYLLVFPLFLVMAFVPHGAGVYRHVAGRELLTPLMFGLLFGVSLVTFGISAIAVGVVIAYAVGLGLNSVCGSLIPLLVLNPEALLRRQGILILVSLALLLLGLFLYVVAGKRREREETGQTGHPAWKRLGIGLTLAIVSGIFGSSLNLGFAFSGDIIQASLQLGAGTVTSTYPVWALVLTGAFVPNLAYCVYLLNKNHGWWLFPKTGWSKEVVLSLAMSVAAIVAVCGYGVGATLLGKYGTSIGFAIFMGATIFASNGFGILTGEWKCTSTRTRGILAAGMATVVVSVVVLNVGAIFMH